MENIRKKFNLNNHLNTIEKNFIIISIIAFFTRLFFIFHVSGDFEDCISEWINILKDNGGLFGLKLDIGDYNAPYVTILALLTYLPIQPLISVKFVSIIFDFICAFAIMKIVKIIFKDNNKKEWYSLIAYIIVLFLPTVVLNSSCWGQADSIYVSFLLLAISCLLEEKYLKSFIFLGISFAFKLQFIFILPLYILIYISKFINKENKFPIYYFLIIPLVNIIMCLPAIIFGKPLLTCLSTYINQTQEYNEFLSMNFPGVWSLLYPTELQYNTVPSPNEYISKIAIIITFVIYLAIAIFVLCKKIKFGQQEIIEFGLLSILIATFFLPHMHDRYLYFADILSILYFIYNKDKLYVPIGIQSISLYCYIRALYEYDILPIKFVSIFNLILLIAISIDIFNKCLKKGDINKTETNYENKLYCKK